MTKEENVLDMLFLSLTILMNSGKWQLFSIDCEELIIYEKDRL